MSNTKNIRIIIARHGLSIANEDSSLYRDGDSNNVKLTNEGWGQSYHLGRFLEKFYLQNPLNSQSDVNNKVKPPRIYLDDYRRVQETLSGCLKGMGAFFKKSPEIYVDRRLIKQSFGGLSHLEASRNPSLQELFKILTKTHKKDPFTTAAIFGESASDKQLQCDSFITGVIWPEIRKGNNDFLLMTHGKVIKCFLASWAHIAPQKFGEIPQVGNCDAIIIEGQQDNWKIGTIYNGETQEIYNPPRPIVDHITKLTVKDLPTFPSDVLNELSVEKNLGLD